MLKDSSYLRCRVLSASKHAFASNPSAVPKRFAAATSVVGRLIVKVILGGAIVDERVGFVESKGGCGQIEQ